MDKQGYLNKIGNSLSSLEIKKLGEQAYNDKSLDCKDINDILKFALLRVQQMVVRY